MTLVGFGWSLLLSQVRRARGHASERQRQGSSVIKFLCSVPERRCLSDLSVVGQRGKLVDRHFRSRCGDQETGSQFAARYGQKHPNKSVDG